MARVQRSRGEGENAENIIGGAEWSTLSHDACFPLASASTGQPDSWCLLLDGMGYKAFITHDLASGNFEPAPAITFPFKFRHGTVIAVTDEEYRRLETTYPAKTEP